jgi:hypothetical protein
MTLVCNGGSRFSSIYIYNDLLFYIIHPIFDNLFCTNIQGRQVFSECIPWYLANRKNTSWFWLILLYCVHLNNFMHIYCRRHIIYNIIKQWIYFFHEMGKVMKNIEFSYLMCFPMSHTKTHDIHTKTHDIHTKTHDIHTKTHAIHTKTHDIHTKTHDMGKHMRYENTLYFS